MEAHGLLADDPLVQLEAGCLQPLFTSGVAGVEDGHVVLFRHGVDGGEEGQEILLRVDVLLPVGGEENVAALLKTQTRMDVAGLDLGEVLVEDLRHGGAGDVDPLLGQAALVEVLSRVLGVAQVHIGDDIHDPAVGLLGQALVLTAVTGLHVENGDVQTLGADDAEAGIGVAQHQNGVGPELHHELIAPP